MEFAPQVLSRSRYASSPALRPAHLPVQRQTYPPTSKSDSRTPLVSQPKSVSPIQRKGVVQLGRRKKNTAHTYSRPGFRANVKKSRTGFNKFGNVPKYDMAHRLSFHDIRNIFTNGSSRKRKRLMRAVAIPARDFDNIRQGDRSYYKRVKNAKTKKAQLSLLNSSPYNLRPGDPSTNRSIGSGSDLRYRSRKVRNKRTGKSRYKRSPSPQSRRLKEFVSKDTGRSSDFLKDSELRKFEKQMVKSTF